MQAPNLNYQKWLYICVGLMVFGIAVGFIGFPKLLRKMIKGVSDSKFWKEEDEQINYFNTKKN